MTVSNVQVLLILLVSILIQAMAAFMAIRLIGVTGRRTAWILIALALVLMTVRRMVALVNLVTTDVFPPLDIINEIVGLTLSVFMFLGISRIAPLFLERKRTEEALRKASDEILDLYNHAPCGYHSLDNDGKFVRMNVTELEWLGYRREDVVGRMHFTDLLTPASLKTFQENFPRFKETGTVRDLEFDLIRKDGSILSVLLNATAIKDRDDNFLTSRSTLYDLTERKRVEQERRDHLCFLENMDKVNRAIQGTNDLERVMSEVLDTVLEIFDCDRVFLMYPCNPNATGRIVPIERNRPGQLRVPPFRADECKEEEIAGIQRVLLAAEGPIQFGAFTGNPLSAGMQERFGFHCLMSTALHLKGDDPWQLGICQSSRQQVWTAEEERLFQEIGRRLADALVGLLAHRHLKKSETMYRLLVNTMAEGVCLQGADGKITSVNPAAERIQGRSAEQMIGRSSKDIQWGAVYEDGTPFPGELHPAMVTLRSGEPQHNVVMGIHRPDNTLIWISVNSQRLISAGERNSGTVITTFHDITQRKRIEEELRNLNENLEKHVRERTADLQKKSVELKESQLALMNLVEDLNERTEDLQTANEKLKGLDRLKSLFIASMSHELRTPLNSIIGFSSILLNEWIGPLTAEQKDNLGSVLKSGKHLLALINDVIDVTKIEAGKVEVVAEEFDLYDVVMEAVTIVTNDIRNKGLQLTIRTDHATLYTDRRRLLQCLLNLVSNAIKFTEKGSIHVEAGPAGDHRTVEIAVSDTGIGIGEEDMDKLFSPFIRLDSPLRSKVLGTGLGLYLTKKLTTEVLKGQVTVSSVRGKGSRFALGVPRSIEGGTS